MASEEFYKNDVPFFKAIEEAEKKGEEDFTCPLCGGKAWWGRSKINNHLHAHCDGCNFTIMQ